MSWGWYFDCGQIYAQLRGATAHWQIIGLVLMGLVLMLCQLVNQWWCTLALSLLAVLSLSVIQHNLFPLFKHYVIKLWNSTMFGHNVQVCVYSLQWDVGDICNLHSQTIFICWLIHYNKMTSSFGQFLGRRILLLFRGTLWQLNSGSWTIT